jgi:hypothetical protein
MRKSTIVACSVIGLLLSCATLFAVYSPAGRGDWPLIVTLALTAVLVLPAWLVSLARTARGRHWGWFALVLVFPPPLPPLGTWVYGAIGPD